MQYWDKNGKIHSDNEQNAGIIQNAYNKVLAGLNNAKNWVEETDPHKKGYQQKAGTILITELGLLPAVLKNQGIKNILKSGIDYEASRIFNVDDGIKRKFLTEEGALNYFKKNYPDAKFPENPPKLTRSEQKRLRDEGKDYMKNNLKGANVDIPGYKTVSFTRKNVGEDYPHNIPKYSDLKDNLAGSKYAFSTNYKREKDRLYDHLVNPNNKAIIDYLTEVIQDNKQNIHRNYKMMKDLLKGDKP